MNRGSTSYGPFSYGSYSGNPVVDFSLSTSEDNQMPVRSIENILDGWNWKRDINSGFARLQFNGRDLFDGQHTEGIGELTRIIDARFVDFEVKDLEEKPPRELQNIADYYRIFVPDDFDYDRDVLQFYAEQSKNFGNVEFIFKVDSWDDDEYVKEVVDEYKIYDSDVWLFPRGRKARTVSERMELAVDFSKKHTWNVSPRLGIMMGAKEEIVDEGEE